MTKRIAHGAFGYSLTPDAYFEAYFKWQKERYGIELHREWMRFGTGVVQSLSTLVNLLTQKMMLFGLTTGVLSIYESHRK